MKSSFWSRALLGAWLAIGASVAQAQDTVQQLADRWVAAYNKHDRSALGAVYADDAQLMMHGAATITGRGKIEQFWAGDFKVDNPLTLLTVTHSVRVDTSRADVQSDSATTPVSSPAIALPATMPGEPTPDPRLVNCSKLGTRIVFYKDPPDAFRKAREERRMVFFIHLSGNFEDAAFT